MGDHDDCHGHEHDEEMSTAVSTAMDTIDSLTGLDKEDHEQVWRSRTKMAWISLWAIIIPTMYIIFRVKDANIIEKLGIMMSWYYLALASIVGAYFGFKAWASIQGK